MNLHARRRVSGCTGPRFERRTSMASLLDSQLKFRFKAPLSRYSPAGAQDVTGKRCGEGTRVSWCYILFFLMTTCLCNVIAPPCLKGLGCLILIDPTGEVSRSAHGGLNAQRRKRQIGGGGKKLLLISHFKVSDGTMNDALRVMNLYHRRGQSHSMEITITGGNHGLLN